MERKIITVNVQGLQGKSMPVHLPQTSTIDQLYEAVGKKSVPPLEPDEVRIIFAGKELEFGKNQTLNDCNIRHNDMAFMVVRVRGGGPIYVIVTVTSV